MGDRFIWYRFMMGLKPVRAGYAQMENDLLFSLLLIGLAFYGLGTWAGLRLKRRRPLEPGERLSLRLALEFSLFAIGFTLVPGLLGLVLAGSAVWSLTSLLLALFWLIEIGRLTALAVTLHGPRLPGLVLLVLVLSGLLLTIEVMNFLVWHSPVITISGLLWLLFLAGQELIALVIHAPNHSQQARQRPRPVRLARAWQPDAAAAPLRRADRDPRSQWMRRRVSGGGANAAPDGRTDGHAHPHRDARPAGHAHRLAFTRESGGPRRADPHAVIRPDPHARR